MTQLAERFENFRKASGLSLDALARKTRVSRGYLWKLETVPGQNPSIAVLLKICEAYGIGVSDFLGEKPGGYEPAVLAAAKTLLDVMAAEQEISGKVNDDRK